MRNTSKEYIMVILFMQRKQEENKIIDETKAKRTKDQPK